MSPALVTCLAASSNPLKQAACVIFADILDDIC